MASSDDVFQQLMAVINDRRDNPPERSYTTKLFQGGVDKIGGKIMEEAAEVVDAAREVEDEQQRAHLVYEAGDLIYHLWVMLGYHRIPLDEVRTELARRFGTSGLDEKAARGTKEKD